MTIFQQTADAFSVPWVVMWSTGVVVFFIVKLATVATTHGWTAQSVLLYVFGTPTLNPTPFVAQSKSVQTVDPDERWWTGLVGIVSAVAVWAVVVPALRLFSDWIAGWAVMTGVVCFLHFGVFRLMTANLRRCGYTVEPLMIEPWSSRSLAEFWGRRWNVAFRDASHRLIVAPLRRKVSPLVLLAAVFLASGLIHDLVMSAGAGGWGQPTLYFIIQAIAQWFSRSRLGNRLGLADGVVGRAFTAIVVLAPLPWLFHRPFSVEIILAFYDDVALAAGLSQWSQLTGSQLTASDLARAGGLLQLSILIASFATPLLLDWRTLLDPLPPLLRQMFWVYGAYIVMTIIALSLTSWFFPHEVAGETTLGHAIAAFTTLFWGLRFAIGLVAFDAKPYLTTRWHEFGYAILNLAFVLLTLLYGSLTIAAVYRP